MTPERGQILQEPAELNLHFDALDSGNFTRPYGAAICVIEAHGIVWHAALTTSNILANIGGRLRFLRGWNLVK